MNRSKKNKGSRNNSKWDISTRGDQKVESKG